MAVRNAGSASIRIKPDAGDFPKELRAQLKAIRDPGFVIDVSADVGQAKADIRRFREVEQGNGMRLGVNVALGQAQADMAAFRARQRADGLTVKVDADTGKARTEIASLRRQVDGFGRADLRLGLGALGLAALQPAATGLAQVAAGLQQVAQAGIAVPGAIAGAAASIGTLALGLFGVKDAYDAVAKASASAGQDQAAQARAASQASNQLRNAVVDETQARKDQARAYRDAKQQLTDLNVEMRGGLISESRAILEAQKAREDLAKGNFSDIRDAQLRVLEADQRLIEVRSRNTKVAQDLNDAQAKGVEGSDLVVSANERVTRAQQQVADAQAAVTDTANKSSAAQVAAAQAMDQLSPSARKFVEQLIAMRPAFDEVRDAAQEPLFAGKADEFRDFFDNIAPNVKQGISGIATAWNQNISALLTSLGSEQGKGIIDRILGNTGEAQSRLSKAIDPLVRGIGTLAAAGTDALPRLADALGSVAARFAEFIEAADKDGRLDRWINDGLTGMTSLGNSVINVSKIFTGITQAAGGGGSFLKWLENLTSKWSEFVNSEEGQSKLREFFTEGLQHLREWGDLLKEIPGAFQSMAQGAQPYVSSLISLFKMLADLIGEHPDLVKTAIITYLTFKTVTPVIGGVQNALTTLSTVVTNVGTGFAPVRDKAKAAMDGVNDTFTKAGKAGSPLSKFSGALSALGGSAGAGVLGLIATVAIPAYMGAMDKLNEKNKQAEESTRALNEIQLQLESTLDRVTGKVTNATVEQALAGAQNYQTSDQEAGGGVEGISKGNAVRAAASLGIPEDVYGKALVGNPEAIQQVRDILLKNNLAPEFQANGELSQTLTDIRGATHDRLTNDDVLRALIGDPEALKKYTEAFKGTGIDPSSGDYSLTAIARRLAPTGQASVLSGNVLNRYLAAIPGAAQNTQELNRGTQGRYRIKPGSTAAFPDNAEVASTGTEAKITVPGNYAQNLQLQGIPFVTNVDGTLTATVPLNSPYIERQYKYGGPTPSGRGDGPTGGHVVEVHDDEWVLPKAARAAVGDDALWALTKGRSFRPGGYIDENGNPIQPGMAPGPSTPPAPIAPNPMASSGGLTSIISNVAAGVQGPVSNAISLGNGLLSTGQQQSNGGGLFPSLGPMDPASVSARASQVPGLIGLIGSMNSSNPEAAVQNWTTNTMNWMADWGTKTLGGLASALWDGAGNGGGLLGFFGLENSILSSSNQYTQAASQGAQFALAKDGPLGTLLGMNGSNGSGAVTDPAALAQTYGVNLDDATLSALFAGPGMGGDLSSVGGDLSSVKVAPGGPGDGGLQVNTLRGKQIIQKNFPWATNIGGVRKDRLHWHPDGLALDVMIPGAGGLNDPTPAAGKAQGDQLYAWLNAHKAELGIDYIMWQEKDHFNHLHVNFAPSGYPGMRDGGPTPSRKGPGPTGGFLAEVHPDEFMISARGRATVPDSFLHALNRGIVDPKELPGYASGGPPMLTPQQQQAWARAQSAVRPAPVRPSVPDIKSINPPAAAAPRQQAPAPSPAAAAAPATPAPSEPSAPPASNQPTQQQPTVGVPQGVAPAPSSIDHNIGWLNTAISSGASTLGNLAATAISMGAAAGGAGAPGAGAGGALAASMVQGLFQQGGKIATDAANVVSSFLVGNVPGSYGDPNMPAYGRVNMPAQDRPVTADYRGGNSYYMYGHDTADVLQEANNNEALQRQAVLATRRG